MMGFKRKAIKKERKKGAMVMVVCSSNRIWSMGREFKVGFGPSPHSQLKSQLKYKLKSKLKSKSQLKISNSASSPPPLRRLILLRHAKSSREDPSLKDHDRPLSKAGESDAIKVSYKLQQLGWIPGLILSSDARRTRETLRIMQEQVEELLEAEIHFISSFYSVAAMDGQTAHHLQQAISTYATDDILTVMCMGHNRGWEEAASTFCGTSIQLNTCNAALLQAPGNSWQEAFLLAGHGGWKLHQLLKPNGIIGIDA